MAVSSVHALAIAWRSIISALPTQIAQGIEETQLRAGLERGISFTFYAPGTVLSCFVCLVSFQPYSPWGIDLLWCRLSYSLSTEDSDSERASGLPEAPQLASASPLFLLHCPSRIGEYLRGCGPLERWVPKRPHRGGRDEDTEQDTGLSRH